MNPIKVGFIGTGKICRVSHIPELLKLQDVAVGVSLFDKSPESAADLGKELLPGAVIFHSLDEFLKSGIDAVIISTPNDTHHPLTMACLREGLHVMVEKPMAATLADADEMIEAADRKNLILQVNQSLRFVRNYALLRKMINEGAIGKPLHIRCIRSSISSPDIAWSPGAKWFLSRKACGGIIMDIAVHMADMMSWYFGPVNKVFALHSIRNPKSEVPDHLATVFDFESGATGILELGWNFPRDVNFLEVYGEKGSLRLGYNPAGPELSRGSEEFALIDDTAFSVPSIHRGFVEAIRNNTSSVCPREVGRDALALCVAIEESGTTGLPVKPHTQKILSNQNL